MRATSKLRHESPQRKCVHGWDNGGRVILEPEKVCIYRGTGTGRCTYWHKVVKYSRLLRNRTVTSECYTLAERIEINPLPTQSVRPIPKK